MWFQHLSYCKRPWKHVKVKEKNRRYPYNFQYKQESSHFILIVWLPRGYPFYWISFCHNSKTPKLLWGKRCMPSFSWSTMEGHLSSRLWTPNHHKDSVIVMSQTIHPASEYHKSSISLIGRIPEWYLQGLFWTITVTHCFSIFSCGPFSKSFLN